MAALLRAIPDLLSAALIYAVWIEPQRFGVEAFRAASLALMLEFFVIHAGGFMAVTVTDPHATPGRRTLRLAGWSAGYLAFISLFALGFQAWWMVGAFAWFCFAKVQAIWSVAPPTERDRWHAIVSWALSVAVFLGAIGITLENDVPMLGVTDALLAQGGFTGSGVWEREPHRAIAGAVLYFAVMGFSRPFLALGFAARSVPRAP